MSTPPAGRPTPLPAGGLSNFLQFDSRRIDSGPCDNDAAMIEATVRLGGLESQTTESACRVAADLLLRLALRGKLVREDGVGVVLKQ